MSRLVLGAGATLVVLMLQDPNVRADVELPGGFLLLGLLALVPLWMARRERSHVRRQTGP